MRQSFFIACVVFYLAGWWGTIVYTRANYNDCVAIAGGTSLHQLGLCGPEGEGIVLGLIWPIYWFIKTAHLVAKEVK